MSKFNIILFAVTCIFISCNKDLGNYEYGEVNQVKISGIAGTYGIEVGIGRLYINPVVEMTMADPDDERFTYHWAVVVDEGSRDIVYELGNSRILDTIPSHIPMGNNYRGFFEITDNTLDQAVYYHRFNINVTAYNSRGWLVIGEDESGYVDIAMLAMLAQQDTVIYDNLFEVTNLPPLRGPQDFVHLGTRDPKLWLMTDSGSYYLDRESFVSSVDNTFNSTMYEVVDERIDVLDVGFGVSQMNGTAADGYSRFVKTSNNSLYFINLSSAGGDFYSYPVNYIDGVQCSVKGKVMYTPNAGMYPNIIWYDGDNERFVQYYDPSVNKESFAFVDSDIDPFPWNQTGTNRTYIYGENTYNIQFDSRGNSYALMLDQSNQDVYIYMFNVGHWVYFGTPSPIAKHLAVHLPAGSTELATAELRAFMSGQMVVLYVKNNEIWALNFNPEGTLSHYRVNADIEGEITMMKFDISAQPGSDFLYIASYKAGEGSVIQKYRVALDLTTITGLEPIPNARWEVNMKVKNINWRGVN